MRRPSYLVLAHLSLTVYNDTGRLTPQDHQLYTRDTLSTASNTFTSHIEPAMDHYIEATDQFRPF
jgi:hypothetical protein